MTLHRTGKTLTLRDTDNINFLTGDKVIGTDGGTNIKNSIFGDTEFSHLRLGFNTGFGKLAAHRLADILDLACTNTNLNSSIAILFSVPDGSHLAIFHLQDSDGHMGTVGGKNPRHPDFFSNNAATHGADLPLKLDLDINTGGKIELHQRVYRLWGRIDNVQKTLVRPHFKLFTAFLIDMR